MNYETALELKNAGWKQENSHSFYCKWRDQDGFLTDQGVLDSYRDQEIKTDFIIHQADCPTLSELIEACTDKNWELRKSWNFELIHGSYKNATPETMWKGWTGLWKAQMLDDEEDIEGFGPSPEEAVARLWLALNKK